MSFWVLPVGATGGGAVMGNRRSALDAFYAAVGELRKRQGGPRLLRDCDGRMAWPSHGVYLFFEGGEMREDGSTPRVVRVGTHALTATSRTRLWRRLAKHRGTVGGRNAGGGNHRGSIFRHHVGTALIARDGWEGVEEWEKRGSAPREARDREVELERAVSRHIGAMPILWVEVADRHERGAVERDLIAMLSNAGRPSIDPPSPRWLGRHASSPAVRESGLWNVNHTGAEPAGDGLALFQERVLET